MKIAALVAALVAATAGSALALAVGHSAATQTVTLGSVSGTPDQNICGSAVNCTYIPFASAGTPGLQVPSDGTVTSFSVNAGSASPAVKLRVLRPAGGGQYTAAATSQAEPLTTGLNNFTVAIPVKAGDLLGLDNASSALLFDDSSATPETKYYEPSLPEGKTAAPNERKPGYRLLLSAVVQSTATTTATGTVPTTTSPINTSPGSTSPPAVAPVVSQPSQSRRVWRVGSRLATISRRPPVGTTFTLSLNERAQLTFSFARQVSGRRMGFRCVAPTKANRSHRSCKRSVKAGSLVLTGHAGANRVAFQGRLSRSNTLMAGRYTVSILATSGVGQRSRSVSLSFEVVS